MREAVIVEAVRTPLGRGKQTGCGVSQNGALSLAISRLPILLCILFDFMPGFCDGVRP